MFVIIQITNSQVQECYGEAVLLIMPPNNFIADLTNALLSNVTEA